MFIRVIPRSLPCRERLPARGAFAASEKAGDQESAFLLLVPNSRSLDRPLRQTISG
jgi:hypothetical protein